MEAVNVRLSRTIDRAGLKQKFVAERAGMHESKLSHHIHGRARLSSREQEKVARVLGVPKDKIFKEADEHGCAKGK